MLIRLIIYYPKIGIPLLLVAAFFWWKVSRERSEAWATSRPKPVAPTSQLQAIRAADPDFSQVILEDFAYRLYASAHRARHDAKALGALAPYLSPDVQASLQHETPRGTPVSHVVVGALRIAQVGAVAASAGVPDSFELSLNFEANLSTDAQNTAYLRETWTLRRDQRARTKPPEQAASLGCPNCGAPFSSTDGRRCAYCGQVVADGRFDWLVVRREVTAREARGPALIGGVTEQGTDNATVRAGDVDQRWAELVASDTALDQTNFGARLRHIYAELNRAWSACELEPMRPLVTDGMYDYLRYWVEAYRVQGLRNLLTDMQLLRSQRVKIVRDKHFDAVTVRIWATGHDATVKAEGGEVVGGSTRALRSYSEYWTLIRSSSARGAARTDASCPSCAAALSITMAGTCAHCGSHLTRGEFDWVLSKIEQDDVYEG
jgi:predicted lipid-binding transport protein (Tim44 family)